MNVTGLDSTDLIRLRIKGENLGSGGGSYQVRGGDGSGTNPETYNGVTYGTAADTTHSAIPNTGNSVDWLAQEVA